MRRLATLLCMVLCVSCGNQTGSNASPKGEVGSPNSPGVKVETAPGAAASTASATASGAPKSPPPASPSASATQAASVAPPASAASSASARGLDAPGNNADIVAMSKSILKSCKFERDDWKRPCQSLTEWDMWFSPGHVIVQDTLIALCGDNDPRVRSLCSLGLQVSSLESIRDQALATALLDALEKERSTNLCLGMARAAGRIDAQKTRNDERITQIIKSHPVARCREAVVESLLGANPHLNELVVNIARADPSPALRSAAARGLREGARKDDQKRANCKVWLEMLDDSGKEHTGQAAALLAEQEACEPQWDDLLKKLDAAVAAGKVASPMEEVSCSLHRHKKAKSEQKSQALAQAKKLVENDKNTGAMRAKALSCVGRHDPEGKAFAAKFADAAAPEVKSAAARVAEGKP